MHAYCSLSAAVSAISPWSKICRHAVCPFVFAQREDADSKLIRVLPLLVYKAKVAVP